MMSLQASLHQGDSSFKGKGKQCLANSACAIRQSFMSAPRKWSKSVLDDILNVGNKLYLDIGKDYLATEDIPCQLGKISESLHGTLSPTFNTDLSCYKLEDALMKVTVQEYVGCVFTMGDSNPCYSSAVLKDSDTFYFFDPHSRNQCGMLACDGFATMTCHKNVGALCLFIRHLAASLKLSCDVQFEVASLKLPDEFIFLYPSSSGTDSEFSGFDSISEGETSCRLYLAENFSDTSSVSSCSSFAMSDVSISSTNIDEITLDKAVSNLDDSAVYLQSIDLESLNTVIDLDDNENVNVSEKIFTATPLVENTCNLVLDDSDDNDLEYQADDDDDDDSSGVNDPDYQADYDDSNDNVKNPDYQADDDDSDDDDDVKDPDYQAEGNDSDGDDDDVKDPDYQADGDDSDGDDDDVKDPYYQADDDDKENIIDDDESDSDDENVPLINYKRKQNFDKSNSMQVQASSQEHQYLEHDEAVVYPARGRGRKRVRNENEWKRNIVKRKKNEGQSYASLNTGRVRPARVIKSGCGFSCRYKCHLAFSEQARESLFHNFWKLGNIEKQRHYLGKYAHIKPKKRKNMNARKRNRTHTVEWTLPQSSSSVRVCKLFFLHTLSVSEKMVRTAIKKQSRTGVCDEDGRGKHKNRPNRVAQESQEKVRKHIESFKCVDSHYCRKDSKKSYLPAGLNLSKMYRMYCEEYKQDGSALVSLQMYRNMFDKEYNLAFHKPTKDRCDFCASYENASESEKESRNEEYINHIDNKNKARENKSYDKSQALVDSELCTACFDLEQVLLTPHGNESCLFYKRRLNTYNFTVYDYGTKDAFCYVWHEGTASRGACETASSLFHFIKTKVSEGKKKFVFYSDNCCAQNKNKFHVSMLWFCLGKFNIKSIQHKYLIKGHTQNEADSVHAAVESASKNIKVYTTPQWAATIRTARHKQPYIVIEMSLKDFFDFKSLASNMKNFVINTENETVKWHSFKTISLLSEVPNVFCYQTDFGGVTKYVELFKRLRSKDIPCPKKISLDILREDGVPIKRDKYVDLLNLCTRGIIPSVHHAFYLLLPHQ